MNFRQWLLTIPIATEVVRANTEFLPQPQYAPKPASGPRDPLGLPPLEEPGFRKQDIITIQRNVQKFEEDLSFITDQFGLHFLAIYLPPESGTPQIPVLDPATGDYVQSTRRAKELGKPGWTQYQAYAQQKSKESLFNLIRTNPEVNESNTIVYVKPTSRVHTLTDWQLVHNIGHGIWDHAKNEGGKILSQFVNVLRDLFSKFHYQKYGSNHRPNAVEIILLLARTLDISSLRKVLNVRMGQLNEPKYRLSSALNSFQETMYELIATFIWNKGSLTSGRRPIKPIHVKMEPQPEVIRMHNWPEKGRTIDEITWKPLQIDEGELQTALHELENIIGEAFKAVTYNKVGPIYSTSGYVTTTA